MTAAPVILVGNDKGGTVAAFRLDDDAFHLLGETPTGAGCSTFAVDHQRGLVYAATKEPTPAVVTFTLERDSGALTELSRREVADPLAYLFLVPATAHASEAASGGVLLGASYHGGWGAFWPVRDGVLGEAASRVEYRNLHAAVADPAGNNAYFVSLGDDLIAQFAIGLAGELIELSEPTVPVTSGFGPRHLVISEDGKNAYLLTEFTGEAIRFDRDPAGRLVEAEGVRAYDISAGLGASGYGWDPLAGHLIWGADLALAAGERWLLCSERTESTIAAIELDAEGRLTQRVVLTHTETQPRGLTVSPDGTRVVVVGERSGHAALYSLDDGELVQLDRVATGEGPNWVRFA